MLEAVNLLPIYRGFRATRNKIAWPILNKCLGLRFSAQTCHKHGDLVQFLPRICSRGLFNVKEVKSKEFGARWGENKRFFLEFQWRVYEGGKLRKKKNREREDERGSWGSCLLGGRRKDLVQFHQNTPYPLFLLQACPIINTASQISYLVFQIRINNAFLIQLFVPKYIKLQINKQRN